MSDNIEKKLIDIYDKLKEINELQSSMSIYLGDISRETTKILVNSSSESNNDDTDINKRLSKIEENLNNINTISIKKASDNNSLINQFEERLKSISINNYIINNKINKLENLIESLSNKPNNDIDDKLNKLEEKINSIIGKPNNDIVSKLNIIDYKLNSVTSKPNYDANNINLIIEKFNSNWQKNNEEINNRINKLESKLDLIILKSNQIQNLTSSQTQNIQNINKQYSNNIQNPVSNYKPNTFDSSVFNTDIKEIKNKIEKINTKFDELLGNQDLVKWLLNYDSDKDKINNLKISSSSIKAINTELEKLYLKDELSDFKNVAKSYKEFRKIVNNFDEFENSLNKFPNTSGLKIKFQNFKIELDKIYISKITLDNWALKAISSSREKILEIYLNEPECLTKDMEYSLKILAIKPSYGESFDEKFHHLIFKDSFDSKLSNNAIYKTSKVGYKDMISDKIIKAKVMVNKV